MGSVSCSVGNNRGYLFGAILVALSTVCGVALAAKREDFNGVWLAERPISILTAAGGSKPPLLPEARKLYDSRLAAYAKGDQSFDQTSWCAAPGIPRLMYMPYPFQIMVEPRRVAFLYEWNRWARVVDMVSKTLEVASPTSTGVATGRWEGGTLVIQSVGVNDVTVLDSAGLMHSDDLKVTERLRLLGPDRLENRITLEDSSTFSRPWDVVQTYRRQPQTQPIKEDVCLDRIKRGEPAIRSERP